ncbi:MAG: hypothetical protein GYB30_05660 [Gammaproteobacteria bacterium]|nr:hypothetical protein [Gammaproteobacteria bacterium]
MGKYDLSDEARATDAELNHAVERLEVLSKHEIANILPSRVDQEELQRLISKVQKATSKNAKRAVFIENVSTASEAVKRALEILT